MGKIIVGMADFNVCKSPDSLMTLGIGSCVGVIIYDKTTKISGMAHIMLPSSEQYKTESGFNRNKFADTAVMDMFNKVLHMGANKATMIAKLAGGAHVFNLSDSSGSLTVGERNAAACEDILKKCAISIVAKDVGGNKGRTIEFLSQTGELFIRTIGGPITRI